MQFRERYDIMKLLGRGTNASVFLVRDKHLDKKWAAKIFDLTHCQKKDLLVIENEIQILKQIESLKMPRIVDLYRESHQICLIMDYMEGISLQHYVEKYGPAGEELTALWIMELCDILQQLHQMSPAIVYCDLKPENVILKKDGHLALIDLGSARQLPDHADKKTKNTSGCNSKLELFGFNSERKLTDSSRELPLTGSRGYTAPELFPREDSTGGQGTEDKEGHHKMNDVPIDVYAYPTPQADIYSIGAVGGFLVTGMHPQYWKQTKGALSKSFVRLVESCLEEKTKRIPDCETLKKLSASISSL